MQHKSFFKIPRKKKGCKTEAPVQAAVDTYLELKGLYNFRIPDELFKLLIHYLTIAQKQGRVREQIKIKQLLKTLKGWPDNMVFKPHGKYLIACPIECKSATGKHHGLQKIMARDLNYLVPRSPEEGIKIINEFLSATEKGIEI